MADLQNPLPAGWDRRLDRRTGKYYYINHYTKTTTWEDPRVSHKSRYIANAHYSNAAPVEHIAMQHGSPEFRRNYVYPSQTTPIPAFQIPAHYSPKTVPLQELSSMSKGSPRGARVQDSSLTTATNTEEAVAKISAMFPTVSDTHIRVLLKKYHNREALVISALQVEKHPITTPGPFATPPPARNIHPAVHAPLQMTPPLGIRFGSRGGSPVLRPGSGGSSSYTSDAYRSSPKPHSPKLKLRYMKSIFPKADETIILDVLSSNDNNIQKASDALKEMGFEKKESAKSLRHKQPPKAESQKAKAEPPIEILLAPKIKSLEDKNAIKASLQERYKDIPEQVITIALESVDFDEERANQILQMTVQEETDKNNVEHIEGTEVDGITELDATQQSATVVPLSQSRQSLKSLLKTEKSDYSLKESTTFSRVIEESTSMASNGGYRSSNIINTNGANRDLVKGANHDLLLEDYVKWQGPQPSLHQGPQKGLAKGPNASLLGSRTYQACGPNAELRKGPIFGLAKGSIFSQLKGVVVGESRGSVHGEKPTFTSDPRFMYDACDFNDFV